MSGTTTLTVGVGKEYATVSAAIAAAQNGDIIAVDAGTYTNDTATINANVTLEAVGGVVNMVETQALPNQKGIFVVNNGATIKGFSFTGAEISAANGNNGAGIRYQGGNLLLENDYFANNQDGLLATPAIAATGTIDIENSEFNHNGAGDGYSHNIYVNDVASFIFNNSYSHDAVLGHDIKSRAENTTITNSRIEDGTGTASYSIDLPNGGNALIQNDVIQQGASSQNPVIISYGEEGNLRVASNLVVNNNTIVNDLTAHVPVGIRNSDTSLTPTVSNNRVYGLTTAQLTQGLANLSNTTYLTARPALDTSSHWQPSVTPQGPTTWTVGNGKQFATVAQAVAVAHTGDTIAVDAGTYTNDTAVLNANVTLKAVGGVVNMVETQPLANGQAIFVVNHGATIQGFSFSGAATAAGSATSGAGVLFTGGNLVLSNDDFQNNQIGLLATPTTNGAGTIDVENSEFANNGVSSSSGHNIYVKDVASFTFNNSYAHDANAAQNIKSRAVATTITNSRIEDGTTGTTSYAIDIANGGQAVIQNNVIEKGSLSQNPTIVTYGEEANLQAVNSLSVSGNTFVDDLTGRTPIGVKNADASITASISNNSIYGLTPAQITSGPASVTGTTQLATRPSLNTASTWQPAPTTTMAAIQPATVAAAPMAFIAQPAASAIAPAVASSTAPATGNLVPDVSARGITKADLLAGGAVKASAAGKDWLGAHQDSGTLHAGAFDTHPKHAGPGLAALHHGG